MENTNVKKLKTFDGVYVPTVLTILGVVMYLRLGWVVGNAGFIGALSIIIIAHIITLATSLSMSSMLSNIELGDGGAYAIVCRSLGLEWGGAIGIPLYISQAMSVAFYITGFVEIWVGFFPGHSVKAVALITWLLLFTLSYISARLAFRIQYFILVAVVLSILSFLFGTSSNPGPPVMLGTFSDTNFWGTFAIFFPAVTGILAGASMSGELENPRKNIINGMLTGVATGFIIYILVAFWFAKQATPSMLLSSNSIIMELSYSYPLIIAGICSAIISSALSTLVGAPRTLCALAQNRSIPASEFLAKKANNGEPRNAILISSIISLVILLLGNLNSLAELLTLFFLTTYGMINLIVFLEQSIGIVSFRPRMKFSIIIPITGFIGCIFVMFLINKGFTGFTFLTIIFIYLILKKRNLDSPWGDVRGGVFTMISEWAAQKAMTLPYHPRLWKPAIIVPSETTEDFDAISNLVANITLPSGRLYYLNIKEDTYTTEQYEEIDHLLTPLNQRRVFISKILIENGQFETNYPIVIQSLLKSFLAPNTVILSISNDKSKQKKLSKIIRLSNHLELGVICVKFNNNYTTTSDIRINLWLRDKSPNTNLAILTALRLNRNCGGDLYILTIVNEEKEIDETRKRFHRLIEEARLPATTKLKIHMGAFGDILKKEAADITIIGMPPNHSQMFELSDKIDNTILFISDSGLENALV